MKKIEWDLVRPSPEPPYEHVKTVYVPIGLPGCGKTTFGNRLCEACDDWVLSMGADDVRDVLYPGYSAGTVPFAQMDLSHTFEVAYEWAVDILTAGRSLWWDAVNTSKFHRAMVLSNCRPYTERVVAIDLYVPFEEILRRNREERQGHRRPPRKTLAMFRSQRHQNPVDISEGFDEVWRFKWTGTCWRWHSCQGAVDFTKSPLTRVKGIGWL